MSSSRGSLSDLIVAVLVAILLFWVLIGALRWWAVKFRRSPEMEASKCVSFCEDKKSEPVVVCIDSAGSRCECASGAKYASPK